MKKNIKVIIGTLVGIVIGVASGIGVYATLTYSSGDISYTKSGSSTPISVESALNELYSSKKTDYTGTTAVTPTNSLQTLLTKDTILKSNITINPIPSTYKNLNKNTTVVANKLLNGITAYDNNGNLITGNLSTNCISFKYTKPKNSQINVDFGFNPSKFYVYFVNPNGTGKVVFFYDAVIGTDLYSIKLDSNTVGTTQSYALNNNILTSNYQSTGATYTNSIDYYVTACQ